MKSSSLLMRSLGALSLALGAMSVHACPPAGMTIESLRDLKAAGWKTDANRDEMALILLGCLSHPDPVLRDDLGYEALRAWMRADALQPVTVRRIHDRLAAMLDAPADPQGVAQPFAALTMAEVARVDRLRPLFSPQERESLVRLASRYLTGVRDLRGFDPREGWRHGVAHGADVLLQLSLNPALEPPQATLMLAAIASQVAPPGEHAWRFGEPERLMAPVFYLARRDWWTPAQWQAWFETLTGAGPTRAPTLEGLSRRHNLTAFLSALYVAVQEQADANVKARLLPGLRQALKALG